MSENNGRYIASLAPSIGRHKIFSFGDREKKSMGGMSIRSKRTE